MISNFIIIIHDLITKIYISCKGIFSSAFNDGTMHMFMTFSCISEVEIDKYIIFEIMTAIVEFIKT